MFHPDPLSVSKVRLESGPEWDVECRKSSLRELVEYAFDDMQERHRYLRQSLNTARDLGAMIVATRRNAKSGPPRAQEIQLLDALANDTARQLHEWSEWSDSTEPDESFDDFLGDFGEYARHALSRYTEVRRDSLSEVSLDVWGLETIVGDVECEFIEQFLADAGYDQDEQTPLPSEVN